MENPPHSMKNMWSSQIYQDIGDPHKHTCLQLQVSGSIWGAGDDGPIFFTVLPLLHPRHQDTGLKQMQQIKSRVLSSCCVCSGEDRERERERERGNLTCGFSKMEICLEVEARRLFLKFFQMRGIQCPSLCWKGREGEGKFNVISDNSSKQIIKTVWMLKFRLGFYCFLLLYIFFFFYIFYLFINLIFLYRQAVNSLKR